MTSTDGIAGLTAGYYIVYSSQPSQAIADESLGDFRKTSGVGDAYIKCAGTTFC